MKMSIIIPMYNVEKYITRCLDSILFQNYDDYEIILVDDGSTDNTLTTVNNYIHRNKKGSIIRIIKKNNSGASDTRNYGLSEAKGDYIVFMDADDYMLNGALETYGNTINTYDADLYVFSLKKNINGAMVESRLTSINSFCIEDEASINVLNQYLKKTDYIITWQPWGKLFKKDIIDKYRVQFDTELYCCNDFNFFFKYFMHVHSVVFTNIPVVAYTVERTGSITTTKIEKRLYSGMRAYEMFFYQIKEQDREAFELLDYASYLYLCSLELCSNLSETLHVNEEINKEIFYYSKSTISVFKRFCYRVFGLKIGSKIIGLTREMGDLIPGRVKFSEM